MVTIEFLGPIDKDIMSLEVASLRELKAHLSNDEELKGWLPNCAVAVNNELIKELDFLLEDGDMVAILPPVCGG